MYHPSRLQMPEHFSLFNQLFMNQNLNTIDVQIPSYMFRHTRVVIIRESWLLSSLAPLPESDISDRFPLRWLFFPVTIGWLGCWSDLITKGTTVGTAWWSWPRVPRLLSERPLRNVLVRCIDGRRGSGWNTLWIVNRWQFLWCNTQ